LFFKDENKFYKRKDNPNPSINNKGLPLSPVLLKIMSQKASLGKKV
jgi:hypothetical protein